MFKKILVAEDYESSNISVEKALEDLKIKESKYVYYCDDALQRVQIGIHEKQTFELLITDLSFDEDHLDKRHNKSIFSSFFRLYLFFQSLNSLA